MVAARSQFLRARIRQAREKREKQQMEQQVPTKELPLLEVYDLLEIQRSKIVYLCLPQYL